MAALGFLPLSDMLSLETGINEESDWSVEGEVALDVVPLSVVDKPVGVPRSACTDDIFSMPAPSATGIKTVKKAFFVMGISFESILYTIGTNLNGLLEGLGF